MSIQSQKPLSVGLLLEGNNILWIQNQKLLLVGKTVFVGTKFCYSTTKSHFQREISFHLKNILLIKKTLLARTFINLEIFVVSFSFYLIFSNMTTPVAK